MLKLKLQYFGHLIWRVDSSGKTLRLGKIEGRRRRGWQRMRWLDGITNSMDMGIRLFSSSPRLSQPLDRISGPTEPLGAGKSPCVAVVCFLTFFSHGWTLGVGDGQGGLMCCDSWSHKESGTTEQLNWTELGCSNYLVFVAKLLCIWFLPYLFGSVPQSCLRGCLWGSHLQLCPSGKTEFSTFKLWIFFSWHHLCENYSTFMFSWDPFQMSKLRLCESESHSVVSDSLRPHGL